MKAHLASFPPGSFICCNKAVLSAQSWRGRCLSRCPNEDCLPCRQLLKFLLPLCSSQQPHSYSLIFYLVNTIFFLNKSWEPKWGHWEEKWVYSRQRISLEVFGVSLKTNHGLWEHAVDCSFFFFLSIWPFVRLPWAIVITRLEVALTGNCLFCSVFSINFWKL